MTDYPFGKSGAVSPDEYDWEQQFSKLDPASGFILLDAGKVYGLAEAYWLLLNDGRLADSGASHD